MSHPEALQKSGQLIGSPVELPVGQPASLALDGNRIWRALRLDGYELVQAAIGNAESRFRSTPRGAGPLGRREQGELADRAIGITRHALEDRLEVTEHAIDRGLLEQIRRALDLSVQPASLVLLRAEREIEARPGPPGERGGRGRHPCERQSRGAESCAKSAWKTGCGSGRAAG